MRALDITTPGERVPLSCVVDPHLKRCLLERARANDRTLSAELRTAIRRHLNDSPLGGTYLDDALDPRAEQTSQQKDEQ
jgi:hypothetical protein